MKRNILIIILSLLAVSCSNLKVDRKDISSIESDKTIGLIVSIPYKLKQGEFKKGITWAPKNVNTPLTIDLIHPTENALKKYYGRLTGAEIIVDMEKSVEYKDVEINGNGTYFAWDISKKISEDIFNHGKNKHYDYLSIIDADDTCWASNCYSYFGVGIITEFKEITYLYASLRVNLIDLSSNKLIDTSTCFVNKYITSELKRIDEEIPLTDQELRIVEKYVPSLIEECLTDLEWRW